MFWQIFQLNFLKFSTFPFFIKKASITPICSILSGLTGSVDLNAADTIFHLPDILITSPVLMEVVWK